MERSASPLIKRKVVNSNSHSHTLPSTSQLKNARTKMKKRKRDFLNRINYSNTFSVVVLPLSVVIYFIYVTAVTPSSSDSLISSSSRFENPLWSPSKLTLLFSVFYFNITLLAFTSGYHKYFTHNSFQTSSNILQGFFVLFGSSLGLGPVRWWASLHRAHHQFTDDIERDPYSIKRGLFWAHWGWLIKKPKITTFYEEFINQEFPLTLDDSVRNVPAITTTLVDGKPIGEELNEILTEVDNSLDSTLEQEQDDLLSELHKIPSYNHRLVMWQNSNYFLCFILTTVVIPFLVNHLFIEDTALNGIIYPGIIRMFLAQQCVLLTESVCHQSHVFSIPTQPFNDKHSSRNCHNPLLTAFTFGQANQNYHHEFPHDYRGSASLISYDPTKWFIWTLSMFGIVDDLCKTPNDLIAQLRIQQQQSVINRAKEKLNWGTPISKLPKITPKDFKRILNSSNHSDRIYIVIQNIIHDITPFMDQHPGGVQLLKASHGKDATKAFFGGVYGHSTAANNLLSTMRIGILDVGNEEEVWRRVVREEGDVNEERGSEKYQTAEAA